MHEKEHYFQNICVRLIRGLRKKLMAGETQNKSKYFICIVQTTLQFLNFLLIDLHHLNDSTFSIRSNYAIKMKTSGNLLTN